MGIFRGLRISIEFSNFKDSKLMGHVNWVLMDRSFSDFSDLFYIDRSGKRTRDLNPMFSDFRFKFMD